MSAPTYPGAPYATPYGGAPMPMGMPPAEVQSLRSMLNIARILTLIIGILSVLGLLGVVAVLAIASAIVGAGVYDIWAVWFVIVVVVQFVIWIQLGEIIRLTDAGQYQAAKDKSILWMILGFIFGWFIVGILVLVAYLKFDPVINWQRQMGQGGAPFAYHPAQSAAPAMPSAMPAAPAPPAAPAAPAAATCPRCGRPAVWIAQYSRWYCYTDQQYI
ncbi:MAG: hypothetical protein L3J93_02800 [Thermoplasmata archaeon]|nr:hypothetical protein [Thermoplasmata archaeon]